MSDYCVVPIKGHWKNWKKLAELAKVSFSPDQLVLAEAIFGHKANKYPKARPRVFNVRECFGPSCPSTKRSLLYSIRNEPVHPAYLLTLLTGIGREEITEHRGWTYRTVASTMLLTHPDGQVFTFMVDGGEEKETKWVAEFLHVGKCIGRSMYIRGYEGNKGFDQYGFFVPDVEGMYGPFYTCF